MLWFVVLIMVAVRVSISWFRSRILLTTTLEISMFTIPWKIRVGVRVKAGMRVTVRVRG